jgi:hypothetical protein
MLHGLASAGAVVLLLIAALPRKLEAAAALAVFAPVSWSRWPRARRRSRGC